MPIENPKGVVDQQEGAPLQIEIAEEVAPKPEPKEKVVAADKAIVEILDDTPEKDRGRPRRPEGQEPDIPTDEEIASYSESVQKRIKRLKFEFHEERRLKEERERQLNEAVSITSRALSENDFLKNRMARGENILAAQAKARVDSEMALARDVLQKAFEAGDAKIMAEAQESLAKLAAEMREIDTFVPRQPPPPQAFQPQPAPPIPRPDYEAVEWAKKNPWFMNDQHMTTYACVLDERLKAQGMNPRSPEHYKAIDEGLRREFPDAFGSHESDSPSAGSVSQPRRQGPVAAPSARSQGNAPRKVTLSASEVALARRLNITPEGYARRKLELMQEGTI